MVCFRISFYSLTRLKWPCIFQIVGNREVLSLLRMRKIFTRFSVVGGGILLGFGLCCVCLRNTLQLWYAEFWEKERERFSLAVEFKDKLQGGNGSEKKEWEQNLTLCVCRESWMWSSVSRLSENLKLWQKPRQSLMWGRKRELGWGKRERERQRKGWWKVRGKGR